MTNAEKKTRATLTAKALRREGFAAAQKTDRRVLVSLTNRRVTKTELALALDGAGIEGDVTMTARPGGRIELIF